MFRRPKSPLGQIQDPFLAMQVPTSHAIFKVINILEEIITTKASEWIRWSSSARKRGLPRRFGGPSPGPMGSYLAPGGTLSTDSSAKCRDGKLRQQTRRYVLSIIPARPFTSTKHRIIKRRMHAPPPGPNPPPPADHAVPAQVDTSPSLQYSAVSCHHQRLLVVC